MEMTLIMILKKGLPRPGVPPPSWKIPPERLEFFMRGNFPTARVLVLMETKTAAMLYRCAEAGTFAGVTWHRRIGDGKSQVEYECGQRATEWRGVPPEIKEREDILAFALAKLEASES